MTLVIRKLHWPNYDSSLLCDLSTFQAETSLNEEDLHILASPPPLGCLSLLLTLDPIWSSRATYPGILPLPGWYQFYPNSHFPDFCPQRASRT